MAEIAAKRSSSTPATSQAASKATAETPSETILPELSTEEFDSEEEQESTTEERKWIRINQWNASQEGTPRISGSETHLAAVDAFKEGSSLHDVEAGSRHDGERQNAEVEKRSVEKANAQTSTRRSASGKTSAVRRSREGEHTGAAHPRNSVANSAPPEERSGCPSRSGSGTTTRSETGVTTRRGGARSDVTMNGGGTITSGRGRRLSTPRRTTSSRGNGA